MKRMKRKQNWLKRAISLGGLKVFVLSDPTLRYREIRFFRTKIVLSGLLAGILTLGFALIGNHLANDVLGLGYNQMALVSTENRMLKEQLAALSAKMGVLQQSIDHIADRGDELRLLVDLSTMDEETRRAGTGGSHSIPEWSFLTGEANEILKNSVDFIDNLSREVQLQKASYEEVYKKYKQNRIVFTHLPAIKPAEGYYSVSGFGMRVHPVLGINRMHEGIDIITDVGASVFAAGDGVVRYAGRTQGGYGTVIEVSHGYGYSTLYAHLSKVYVRPGQTVKRGDLVARTGRSGLVSGPHLHYEVKYRGRKLNPLDYFFDDVNAATYKSHLSSLAPR